MLSPLQKIPALCLSLFLSTTLFAFGSNSTKQVELAKVNNQIQQLQKNMRDDLSQRDSLEQELKGRELKLSALSQEIEKLNVELNTEQEQLKKLEDVRAIQLAQLTKQRETLAKQVQVMYKLGKMQSVKTVLNPDDVNTLSRHMHYYQYLNESRLVSVKQIKVTLEALNANLAEINQHQQNLKNLLQAKQQQQANEKRLQQNRQQVIVEIGKQNQTKQQQLSTLLANQKTLQDMLDTYQSQDTAIGNLPFTQLRGRLNWPLKGSIGFARNEFLNDAHQNGVLIQAPEGAKVHAIYDGKVIFANWLRGFGLLVIINHGNGFMSLYARNKMLYIKPGDFVKARDVIASIGNTGGFSRSGLYFEIRKNGSPINAKEWCRS